MGDIKNEVTNDIDNDNRREEKIIYTVQELKQILGIGINQCYELVNSGVFPVKHIGKKMVIPVKPFMEWLNN